MLFRYVIKSNDGNIKAHFDIFLIKLLIINLLQYIYHYLVYYEILQNVII